MKSFIVFFMVLFSTVVQAETIYVGDNIKITVRTGPGIEHKIVAMIRSGESVEVLKSDEEWSLVRISNGKEGWVLSRFLTSKEPDSVVIERLQQKHKALTEQVVSLIEENKAYKEEINKLNSELKKNKKILNKIKSSNGTLKKKSNEPISSIANNSRGEEYDFRKTKWGMSQQKVLGTETLKPVNQDEGLIGYKTRVLDKNVLVAYLFVQDKLVRAKYILAETHSNCNDFIIDYENFKEILAKKYGQPKEDKVYWRNDLYKDDYAHWGTAIKMGHLVYFSLWETASTKIACLLQGENFDIDCIIEYSSKSLKHLEEKQKGKKAIDAF